MHITDSAYIAVLENKLIQSERSLYEFRQIFQHWTEGRISGDSEVVVQESDTTELLQKVHGTRTLKRNSDGSYPGQLPAHTVEDEGECLE